MAPAGSAPTTRKERKQEETKRKIIAAALKSFAERGLDATTMEQIAADADIAKGTLYNYFPVKEAIIGEYIERVSRERNSERIQRLESLPDTRARMVQVLGEMMAWVRTQADIFEKYFTYRIRGMIALSRDADGETGLRMIEAAIIRLGQESGEIRSDLPFEILEGLFEFTFVVTAQQFYKDPENFNEARVIEPVVDLFLNGAGRIRA
jgi:AcrR family transcriptional regulator